MPNIEAVNTSWRCRLKKVQNQLGKSDISVTLRVLLRVQLAHIMMVKTSVVYNLFFFYTFINVAVRVFLHNINLKQKAETQQGVFIS